MPMSYVLKTANRQDVFLLPPEFFDSCFFRQFFWVLKGTQYPHVLWHPVFFDAPYLVVRRHLRVHCHAGGHGRFKIFQVISGWATASRLSPSFRPKVSLNLRRFLGQLPPCFRCKNKVRKGGTVKSSVLTFILDEEGHLS